MVRDFHNLTGSSDKICYVFSKQGNDKLQSIKQATGLGAFNERLAHTRLATTVRWAVIPAGTTVRHRRCGPPVTFVRFVIAHIAISGLDVSTHLRVALSTIVVCDGVCTAYILCGTPDDLSQMTVVRVGKISFVFNEPCDRKQ